MHFRIYSMQYFYYENWHFPLEFTTIFFSKILIMESVFHETASSMKNVYLGIDR